MQSCFSTHFIRYRYKSRRSEFSIVISESIETWRPRWKREEKKNMQYSLTNLYQASSGFPINSKHEVWRFYSRLASSAHKSCANSLQSKEMFGKCRGDAAGSWIETCFDSPLWDSVRDTQIRSLCARVAWYYDNPDAYSRRSDGHGS